MSINLCWWAIFYYWIVGCWGSGEKWRTLRLNFFFFERFTSQLNIMMYSQTNVESQITLTTLYGKKITNIIKSPYPICASAILKKNIWLHIKI